MHAEVVIMTDDMVCHMETVWTAHVSGDIR